MDRDCSSQANTQGVPAAASNSPSHLSDEEVQRIISTANSGMALCGIRVNGVKGIKHPPPKQILQPPSKASVKLLGQSTPTTRSMYTFRNDKECKEFYETIRTSGMSAAMRLVPPLTTLGGEAYVHRETSHRSETLNCVADGESLEMECIYVPMKSFRISQQGMLLSEEAMKDARTISNLQEAKQFLEQYYSHVSDGLYHLGGILFSTKTSQSQSNRSKVTSRSQKRVGGGIGITAIADHPAAFGFRKERQSEAAEDVLQTQNVHNRSVQILGGPANAINDPKVFAKGVEAAPESWAIIDSVAHGSPTFENLVPVWDLMLQTGEKLLQRPAGLLREAWQWTVACHVQRDENLLKLHQKSIIAMAAAADEHSIAFQNTSEVQNAIVLGPFVDAQKLDEISDPQAICEKIQKLWVSVPDQLRVKLLTMPPVVKLVKTVNTSPRDDMKPAKELLRSFLLTCCPLGAKIVLEEAEVDLAPLLISKGDPSYVIEPPSAVVTLDSLHDGLNKLLQSNLPSLEKDASTSSHDRRPDQLTEAISSILKEYINSQHPASLQVTQLICRYGFQANGDAVSNISLKAFELIIEDIKVLKEKERNSQPTSVDANLKLAEEGLSRLTLLSARAQDKAADAFMQEEQKALYQSAEVAADNCLPKHNRFTYTDDIMTHRPLPQQDKYRTLLDRINHSLEPFNNITKPQVEDDFWGPSSEETGEQQAAMSVVIDETDAAKSFVYILQNSDLPAQIYFLRVLLNQRWGIPLIFSIGYTLSTNQGQSNIFHTMQALEYVLTTTKIGPFSGDCLLEVTDCPRVVFLSEHSSTPEHEHMARQVTKFRFLPFPTYENDDSLYVQLGMGFLPTHSPSQVQLSDPYVALVVSGSMSKLKHVKQFICETADCIIIQVHATATEHCFKNEDALAAGKQPVLHWAINSSGAPGLNRENMKIWGSSTHVANTIIKFLGSKIKKLQANAIRSRNSLKNICIASFEPKCLLTDPEGLQEAVLQTDFRCLRTKLLLQLTFKQEAYTRFEILKLRHDQGEKQVKLRECCALRIKRGQDAILVAQIPFMQFFIRLLSEMQACLRTLGILKLQNLMYEKSHMALQDLTDLEVKAFKSYQKERTPEAKEEYNNLRDQLAERVVGLEHLWRELCHLYLANPQGYTELPRLAAHHLLDGFALEILDGDAKLFCDLWVKSILLELDALVTSKLNVDADHQKAAPRILVLSVLGTQSSGKSTLLNVMFGTHLPTRAGRCTRGVWIQLLKSEWPEYDYILLMDTEGIRCPEKFGEQDELSHDNRLATFAILPSDACIMVVANEDDSSLKEVLPMVLIAFKGSAAAEKSGGRLRSKLFFAYRSIDISEQSALRSNKQKLLEYLVEAERNIAHSHGEKLFDFRVDEQEEYSDVKFFGNYKKESTPPEDTPDPRYGEKALQLREYCHKRVTEDSSWKPFTLKELVSYMNLVWSCIWEADFELSFKDAVEYRAYVKLQERLQDPRRQVSVSFEEEFKSLEQTLLDDSMEKTATIDYTPAMISNSACNTGSKRWGFVKAQHVIDEQSKRVEQILEERDNKWLKTWKAEERAKWKDFLVQQEAWFTIQLEHSIASLVWFDNMVNECDQQIQHEVMMLHNLPLDDPRRQSASFETVFDRILKKAKASHKPLSDKVPLYVHNVYARHKDIDHINDTDDDPISSLTSKVTNEYEPQFWMELQKNVLEPALQNARQYSDYLVEEAISQTNSFMNSRKVMYDEHRQRRALTHAWVKNFINHRLCEIQHKWDVEHNPAEKLKKQKERLELFYNTHMQGQGPAKLLCNELISVFVETLKPTVLHCIVWQVCKLLETRSWLTNWQVMRGLLDALLLKLLQEKKYDHVLDYVSDGALHHRIVVEELLKDMLRCKASRLLSQIREKVNDAVLYASANATAAALSKTEKHNATAIFRDKVIERLRNALPARTEICVALYRINPDAYKPDGRFVDFENNVKPIVLKKVHEICDEVQQLLGTEIGLRDVADMVKGQMVHYDNMTFRARCEEKCPRCAVTCFLPAFHSSPHDTLHQPQGFTGVVWKDSKQLSHKTCSQHYHDNDIFSVAQPPLCCWKQPDQQAATKKEIEMYSYRKFSTVYPTWQNPISIHNRHSTACKVRECIFYHCQEQLVERYSPAKVKANNNCAHFAHDIAFLLKHIQLELPDNLCNFINDLES